MIKKKVAASKKKTVKKPIKKPAKKKALKTYIALILDRSGSMNSIRSETIAHFNEQIEQITSSSKGMETLVSFVTFNHGVEFEFFNEPTDKLQPLTLKKYVPDGSTAMYDAIGLIIDRLEKEAKDIKNKDVAVLIVTLSDGQENASHRYTSADIAERIQRLQKTDRWTFSYLGANQDLSKIAQDLHIPKGNIQSFVASARGMSVATNQSVGSTQRYLGLRSAGITSSQQYYVDPNEPKDVK